MIHESKSKDTLTESSGHHSNFWFGEWRRRHFVGQMSLPCNAHPKALYAAFIMGSQSNNHIILGLKNVILI